MSAIIATDADFESALSSMHETSTGSDGFWFVNVNLFFPIVKRHLS